MCDVPTTHGAKRTAIPAVINSQGGVIHIGNLQQSATLHSGRRWAEPSPILEGHSRKAWCHDACLSWDAFFVNFRQYGQNSKTSSSENALILFVSVNFEIKVGSFLIIQTISFWSLNYLPSLDMPVDSCSPWMIITIDQVFHQADVQIAVSAWAAKFHGDFAVPQCLKGATGSHRSWLLRSA